MWRSWRILSAIGDIDGDDRDDFDGETSGEFSALLRFTRGALFGFVGVLKFSLVSWSGFDRIERVRVNILI